MRTHRKQKKTRKSRKKNRSKKKLNRNSNHGERKSSHMRRKNSGFLTRKQTPVIHSTNASIAVSAMCISFETASAGFVMMSRLFPHFRNARYAEPLLKIT